MEMLELLPLALLPLPYIVRTTIRAFVDVYILLIIIWAIMSWVDVREGWLRDVYRALDNLVRPYVDIFSRAIPTVGGISFAPIIAIVLLRFVVWVLV